jgi:hypothetical protein
MAPVELIDVAEKSESEGEKKRRGRDRGKERERETNREKERESERLKVLLQKKKPLQREQQRDDETAPPSHKDVGHASAREAARAETVDPQPSSSQQPRGVQGPGHSGDAQGLLKTAPGSGSGDAAASRPAQSPAGEQQQQQKDSEQQREQQRAQQKEHEAAMAWLASEGGATVNADCFICLEPLRRRKRGTGECMVTLACRHGFHAGCFMRYGGMVCPVCRRNAGPAEEEDAVCCDDCDAKEVGLAGQWRELACERWSVFSISERSSLKYSFHGSHHHVQHLWMCLECGNVGCSRQQWHGISGRVASNGHALG